MRNLNILIPPELEARINLAKKKTGITKGSLVKSALLEYLQKNGL